MTVSDERIERAARAVARMLGHNPDELWMTAANQMAAAWTVYTSAARAALEADAPEIAAAETRGRLEGLSALATEFLRWTRDETPLVVVRKCDAYLDARIIELVS